MAYWKVCNSLFLSIFISNNTISYSVPTEENSILIMLSDGIKKSSNYYLELYFKYLNTIFLIYFRVFYKLR